MVSNIEGQVQWTFAIALSVSTVVAVGAGHINPKLCRWFYDLKRKWCLPMMLVSIVIAAVFTVSGIGIFLWFRDRSDFRTDYYDSVLGLHVGVLGALYFFGKFFFLWKNFPVSAMWAVLAFAASTVALVLLGIEGNRRNQWAPFGLYFALPVFLLYLSAQVCYIWAVNEPILMESVNGKKKGKYVHVERSHSKVSGEHSHHKKERLSVAVVSDEPDDGEVISW